MKRILFTISIIVLSIITNAQITLEQTFPDSLGLFVINLETSGSKYVQYNGKNLVKLYNMDHSIFKEINLPVPENENVLIHHITEHLFNSDDNIELLISKGYWDFGNDMIDLNFVKIIDETGNIIFERDSFCVVTNRTSSYYGYEQNEDFIYNTNNGTKMILHSFKENDLGQKIYSLPGDLNCLPCSSSTNKVLQRLNDKNNLSNYPNPAKNYTIINYEIPKGENEAEIQIFNMNGQLIKTYKVDKTFNDLRISTSELSNGTYVYNIKTRKGISKGKKLIINK